MKRRVKYSVTETRSLPPGVIGAQGDGPGCGDNCVKTEATQQPEKPKPKKPALSGTPHEYDFSVFTTCRADNSFFVMRLPMMSAPFAPFAAEGDNNRTLIGNNPILQRVNSANRMINNVTREGHEFYPGDVYISTKPEFVGSTINVRGIGTGPNPSLNEFIGRTYFGMTAVLASLICTANPFL